MVSLGPSPPAPSPTPRASDSDEQQEPCMGETRHRDGRVGRRGGRRPYLAPQEHRGVQGICLGECVQTQGLYQAAG